MLPALLLAYDALLRGMRLKQYFWMFIFENFKKRQSFFNNDKVEGTLGLILGRFYLEWLL